MGWGHIWDGVGGVGRRRWGGGGGAEAEAWARRGDHLSRTVRYDMSGSLPVIAIL